MRITIKNGKYLLAAAGSHIRRDSFGTEPFPVPMNSKVGCYGYWNQKKAAKPTEEDRERYKKSVADRNI